MTREEIIAAIRECAAKLKRNPRRAELRRMKGLKHWAVRDHFGTLTIALRAAGLHPRGTGHPQSDEALLLDWARVARGLGRLPSQSLYTRDGQYSIPPFFSHFGSWVDVPRCFVQYVLKEGFTAKWKDVLAMIADRDSSLVPSERKLDPNKHRPDRPVYGPPVLHPGVANAPVNEAGVVFLFGAVAHRLGFVMLRMQTAFPDCEAMREVGTGYWQRVRIEFEFASRGFKEHGHNENGCDLIVCWIHDWPECPKSLEVLELRKAVGS